MRPNFRNLTEPILRGPSRRTGFAAMLFKHPVRRDVAKTLVASGDNHRRLPICWDAPGSRPFVDSIRVRTDFIGQSLSGRPCVDQGFEGVLLCHTPYNGRFFHFAQAQMRWKFLQWRFFSRPVCIAP